VRTKSVLALIGGIRRLIDIGVGTTGNDTRKAGGPLASGAAVSRVTGSGVGNSNVST
jgi:hypothetical protein